MAPAVSVLQLLKSGTLSLRLFECVPAMIPSAINSRPTTSSRPSNPLSAFSLAPQIRLWLTIVRVYKLYFYLLTLDCLHTAGWLLCRVLLTPEMTRTSSPSNPARSVRMDLQSGKLTWTMLMMDYQSRR